MMKRIVLLVGCLVLLVMIIPGQAAFVVDAPIPSNDWTKHPSNPVVDAGDPGSWDENWVIFPSVIKDGSTYMMWYRGVDAGGTKHIGLAISGDGMTWTKDPVNPVLASGGPGSWDERINSARVIKDGATYKMWYAASDGSALRTGYATSDDGKNWSKHPDNPVLDVGAAGAWDEQEVSCPHVIMDGTTYKMWYTGKDNDGNYGLGYATSSNGIVWTKYSGNPVLTPGASGTWDHWGVLCSSVLMDGTAYRMWYFGKSDSDPSIDSIGYATSSDGIAWTKDANNPVLEPGAEGEWDDFGVSGPSVILDGSTFKMWYQGWQGLASSIRIGYATSPTDYRIFLPIVLNE
jgi:predicted GH43/DUF377 family glycosyl hydrolase